MGDGLEISANNAVNGVTLNTDKLCFNTGDVDHCMSVMPSGDLLVIKKMDDIDRRNDTNCGENDEPVPSPTTASTSVDNQHEDYLNPEVKNCVNDDDKSNSGHENDPSHSVSESNTVSDSGCDGHEANKHGLDEASYPDCIVTTGNSCSVIQNSAADEGNIESQCTVQDNPSCSQRPASPVASDIKSVSSDLENSEAVDLPASRSDENHCTGESCVDVDSQLQLECEDNEVETVFAESEKPDDVLTCKATDEYSNNSRSLSTSQVSAADVITSSATSLSTTKTIVISTPLLTSLSVSGLTSRVSVLSVPSSTGVTRPSRQSDKSLAISVPSATVRSSSSTRLMSKVLQDVGLLLVSQKVFKSLASIQKHKIGGSQKKCDLELLQKLKTSHQNLVAKNRGLLIAERKCWCGFRSESVNVLEAHRLVCDFQGRCCYCHGEFVYRTQKQMKRHLWKVHRKVGHIIDRIGTYMCVFCPLDFTSRLSLMRHIDVCRRKFWLAANLAPKEYDKDIPVTATSKQPVQIPVMVSSTQILPVTATQNLSGNASVSSATLISPTVMPPAVNLQFAPAPRNPGPLTQLLQIGKQLFTLLPSTTVAGSAIAVNQSSAIKSVSKMALKSAIQTAQNANSALPITVNNSTNQTASQAVTMPSSVLQCSLQYSVCSVCSAFVKDKTALLVHMHIAHGSTHKMCQYCCSPDVTFPNLTELHCHIAKFHTSDCWICKTRFQPPDHLINHIADRHKVTMAKMLELRRCYLCSSVPALLNYTAFEEHMMTLHSLQFSDTGKLWDYIVHSPNADKSWYAKRNPDGTLECPLCHGQFISASFLYRHLHLEHDGNVVRLVRCRECGKRMPSNILLVHCTAAHTRKCSVQLSRVDISDCACIFVPPVGTKRKKNKKGELASGSPPLKCVKAAEMVIISDDDDSDDEEYDDDSNDDEDFVLTSQINVQPKHRLRQSIHTRVDHRDSSVDDVHEVLKSIVAKQSVSFVNSSICPASVAPAVASQLCNGITEAEVEIIDSIVPTICRSHQQPVSKPDHNKRDYVTDSTADAKSIHCEAVDAHTRNDKSGVELADYRNGDCQQPSTKPKSTLAESSARHLMARDQIMMNSVEEVLEIDGETVLIVHDDDDDDEAD